MPVVGTLTVDLVANTATFTADLGKAGNSLDGFGKEAEAAGEQVDFSMRGARGSMMLLGDEIGVHLPREIRTMIAEIPGIGLAFEALLPIFGVVFALEMVSKFIEHNKKAAEEVAAAWEKSSATTEDIFAKLGDRMLEVGKKADELAGNHVAALQKQLALVDRQTMTGIIGELDKMGKEADNVFTKMQSNWFMRLLMGREDTGPAKQEIAEMIAEIDKLKGSGADPGNATRALLGTDIDAVGEEIAKLQGKLKDFQDQKKAAEEAGNMAVALSIGGQVRGAQQRLDLERQNLATLEEMRSVATETADIGDREKSNDSTKAGQDEAKKAQEAAEKVSKLLMHAHADLRKELEDHYDQEAKIATEQLDGQLRIEMKASSEKMKNAEAENREAQKIMMEELKFSDAIAVLEQAAREQNAKHRLAMHSATDKDLLTADLKAIQERLQAGLSALSREEDVLAASGMRTAAEMQKMEDKKTEIIKKAENERAKLEQAAAEKQYQDMKRAMDRTGSAMSADIAHSIMEHKSLADSLAATGKQMEATAMENALKMIAIGDMKQAKDAAHAAGSAFKWAMDGLPFPVNAIIAPIAAASAFAGVMAFEEGGKVPGTGPVPSINHGGETVVTKALTDRVEASEGKGRGSKPVTINMQVVTKDADGFKQSQSQLHSKAFHAANVASKRNR